MTPRLEGWLLDLARPAMDLDKVQTPPGGFVPLAKQVAALLRGIALGSSPVAASFNAGALLMGAGRSPCYGPSMAYTSHPDGTPSAGQLPGGDLGIWKEVDASGNACAAAELNARMDGIAAQADMALIGLAAIVNRIFASGMSLPSAGTTVDVTAQMNALALGATFTVASLSLDGTGTTWSYTLTFSFTVGGMSHNASVTLTHTPGSSPDAFSGLLSFKVDGMPPSGACASATTNAGTLKYAQTSATALTLTQRASNYCATLATFSASAYAADGQIDPAYTYDLAARPQGWANDFSRFGGSYDPTSTSLAGSYAYAWQAGSMDDRSRILDVRINSATPDGEAYFGFGDNIGTTNGSIKGFICNWAGPGNSHTYQAYAQRQNLTFNSTTGLWTQPTGGSDVRYAPTNSCQYTNAQRTGGATFWYDRDLTGATTGMSSQANLIVDPTDTTYPFDLMTTTSGGMTYPTITEAIAARGYTLPSSF